MASIVYDVVIMQKCLFEQELERKILKIDNDTYTFIYLIDTDKGFIHITRKTINADRKFQNSKDANKF